MEWRRSARGPARLSRAAGAPSGIRAGLQGAEDRGRVRDGQGDVRVGAASTPWPSSTPCTPGTTKPTTSPGGTAVLHGVLQDEQLQLRRVGLPHMLRGHRDLQHTSHTRRLLQNLLGSPHSRPVHESERVWSLQGRDQLRVRSDMHLPEVSSIWGPSQSCRCALSAVQVSLSARERERERATTCGLKCVRGILKNSFMRPAPGGAPAPRPRRHHAQASPAARGASAPTRGEQNF